MYIEDMAEACKRLRPDWEKQFLLKTRERAIMQGIGMSRVASQRLAGLIERGHVIVMGQHLYPRETGPRPPHLPQANAPHPEFRAAQETSKPSGWQRLAGLFRLRHK